MSTRKPLTGLRKFWSEEQAPISGLLVIAVLATLPLARPGSYLLHISALVFVYVALGLGLNIVVGLAGLLDLGYVGFYAVGAYGYALLTTRLAVSFIPALFIAAFLAAMMGVILGWPTIRTRGDYLALVTLGFGEMIRLLARNWIKLTNGPQGLMNVSSPTLGPVSITTPVQYYYLSIIIGSAAFLLFWRVKHSSVGLQLAAIRDDEDSAGAVGVDPVRWKLYAFALGAWVAGMAGVFFASWQRFVSPESFTLNESILVLCIVVLGGIGRTWPTVVGAAFLVLLPEALRGLDSYRALVLGLMLVLVVILQEKIKQGHRLSHRPPEDAIDEADFQGDFTRTDPLPNGQKSIGEVLLSVKGISKAFGGVCALKDVSLEVRQGEVIGIVGANGAGKTTLFNCIASIEPDGGEILLTQHGIPQCISKAIPMYRRAQLGIVRTFQESRLFSSLTALENVEVGARCHSVPTLWDPLLSHGGRDVNSHQTLKEWLRTSGGPEGTKIVIDMSFVERKITELVRALASKPALLLADEPAAGLAPEGRRHLARVLQKANREGMAIVVVEHDLEFLNSICSRFVVMCEGSIVADGGPRDPTVVNAIRQSYALG